MKLKLSAYFLFFILCLGWALIHHFPKDAVEARVNENLSQSMPGLSLEFQNLAPSPSLGMGARTAILNYKGKALGKWENPRLRLKPASLFQDHWEALYQGGLLGGQISGLARMAKNAPQDMEIQTHLETLTPQNLDLGPQWQNTRLNATLGGDLTTRLEGKVLKGLQAKLWAQALALEFPTPRHGLGELKFSTAQLDLHTTDAGKVAVDTCLFKGPTLDIKASGVLTLGPKLQDTQLNLDAQLTLHPLFFMTAGKKSPQGGKKQKKTKIRLTLTGTLDHPRISLKGGKK